MSFLETLSNTECPICLLPLWPEEYLVKQLQAPEEGKIKRELNDVENINDADDSQDGGSTTGDAQNRSTRGINGGTHDANIELRSSSLSTNRNGPPLVSSPVTIAAHLQQEMNSSSPSLPSFTSSGGGNVAAGVCNYESCKDADAVVVLSCGHLLHSTCAMQLIEYKRGEANPHRGPPASVRAPPASTSFFQGAEVDLQRLFEQTVANVQNGNSSSSAALNSMHSALQAFFHPPASTPNNDSGFSCPVCRGRALSSAEELVVLNPKTIAENLFQSHSRTQKKAELGSEGSAGDANNDDVQCLDSPSDPQPSEARRKRRREGKGDSHADGQSSSDDDRREERGEEEEEDGDNMADEDVHVVGTRHTGREKVYKNRLQRYSRKLYGKYKNVQNRNNVLAKTVERLQQEFTSLENTRTAATRVLEVLTAPSSAQSGAGRGHNNTVNDRIARLQELRNAAQEAQALLAAETETQAELLRESAMLDDQTQEVRGKLRRLEVPKRSAR